MQDPNDPESMTPEERVAETGRILAAGYLRHRARRPPAAAASPAPVRSPVSGKPSRSPENDLDRPGDQSVHVPYAEGP